MWRRCRPSGRFRDYTVHQPRSPTMTAIVLFVILPAAIYLVVSGHRATSR
ncbi:hypothetical protein ABZ635_16775 [Nocardiopsis sp. NPDC007018]